MSLMRTIPVLKGLISMLSAPNVCAFTHTLVWATTKSPTQHSVFPTQRSVDKHASTKCPSDRNNFGNSYNYLTFNRQISLYTITQCTKTKEMCLKKDFFFRNPFLLCCVFLPPRQDIASLAYPDGFRQAQAVWLRETRQDGLSAPSPCCKE